MLVVPNHEWHCEDDPKIVSAIPCPILVHARKPASFVSWIVKLMLAILIQNQLDSNMLVDYFLTNPKASQIPTTVRKKRDRILVVVDSQTANQSLAFERLGWQ